jgi:phage I-like protein
MGCIVVPGSKEDRYLKKAWAEGRIVPMNEAARRNMAKDKGPGAAALRRKSKASALVREYLDLLDSLGEGPGR